MVKPPALAAISPEPPAALQASKLRPPAGCAGALGAKPAQLLEKPCNVPNCGECGAKWNECATCADGYWLKNKRCFLCPVCQA